MTSHYVRRLTVHLTLAMLLATPWLSSLPAVTVEAQETVGNEPLDIWSTDYVDDYYPWGGDDRTQFKEYHDYFTMRDRMMALADRNPSFIEFHEGMPGGTNDRDQETTGDTYEGW